MTASPPLRVLLLAAPLIFIAHVAEEAPSFVTWVNTHIERDITQSAFWNVNAAALGITLVVVLFEWVSEWKLSALLVLTWLGVLMAGNAVLHIGAAIVDGSYVPGVATAVLLYVPYSALVLKRVVRLGRLSAGTSVNAMALGALPMLAHGYLILFRSSRLF